MPDLERRLREMEQERAWARSLGRAVDEGNAQLHRIVVESRLRNLIRKTDKVWNGVIWRLTAIGALSVMAAVAGGWAFQ